MRRFQIVKNDLGEYGAKVLDRTGLHPWESENGLLRHKYIMSDRYSCWFRYRWEVRRLVEKIGKRIEQDAKHHADLHDIERRRNTIKEVLK